MPGMWFTLLGLLVASVHAQVPDPPPGVLVLVYGWVLVGTLPHFTALLGFSIWRAIKRPTPTS